MEGERLVAENVRRALSSRRASQSFSLDWGGYRRAFEVTCGYYDDGTLGEIFINGGKSGEQVEGVARDGAVLLSIALQYGTHLDVLKNAITRDVNGAPQSIIGAVLDELTRGGYERFESRLQAK